MNIRPLLYYSKYVDGLETNSLWFGNILCNPPYSSEKNEKIIPLWLKRIHLELTTNDRIKNIYLILYNSRKHSRWYENIIADSQRKLQDKLRCTIYMIKDFRRFPQYFNGYFLSEIGTFYLYHYSNGKESTFSRITATF